MPRPERKTFAAHRPSNGFDLTYRPHKLRKPLKRKEPALIFVNSMSDYFDERVPDEWRDRVLEVMADTPHLQYQMLTKRPKVMVDYCERREMPENVWLGVSVELPLYLSRVDLLRKARGTGPKFISAEPLQADLGSALDLSGISQVIAGGESGLHLRDPALCARRGMTDPPPGKPTQLRAGFLDRTEFRGPSIFVMPASKLAWHSSGNNGVAPPHKVLATSSTAVNGVSSREHSARMEAGGIPRGRLFIRAALSGEPNTSTVPAPSH